MSAAIPGGRSPRSCGWDETAHGIPSRHSVGDRTFQTGLVRPTSKTESQKSAAGFGSPARPRVGADAWEKWPGGSTMRDALGCLLIISLTFLSPLGVSVGFSSGGKQKPVVKAKPSGVDSLGDPLP